MDARILDRVLTELAAVLGDFAGSTVIGGGVALLIYRQYFALPGNPEIAEPAATKDVDVLIPRALPKHAEDLNARLHQAKFERTTHSLEIPPVEAYIGTLQGEEVAIEFLTDRKSRGPWDRNVLVAGVSAQPLSYIEMSRDTPMLFKTSQGASLRVVSPAPWMFHKALTFPRRQSREKKAKDLYGIWYVGSQLADYSEAALHHFKELLPAKPKSWRRDAEKNLKGWVLHATSADWELLEAQDPQHVLTKARFQRFIDEDFGF